MRRLQGCFPKAAQQRSTWDMGGGTWEDSASGPRIFASLEHGTMRAVGGQAHWYAREAELPDDEILGGGGRFAIGADGYAEGWQVEAAIMVSRVAFDGEGMPVWAESREHLTLEDLAQFEPGPQLFLRARIELGELEVVFGAPRKRPEVKGNFINLRADLFLICPA